jgi:hypothetical protein
MLDKQEGKRSGEEVALALTGLVFSYVLPVWSHALTQQLHPCFIFIYFILSYLVS